jgi:hypothetical protein
VKVCILRVTSIILINTIFEERNTLSCQKENKNKNLIKAVGRKIRGIGKRLYLQL